MITIDLLGPRLDGFRAEGEVHRANCPAHEDHEHSLVIRGGAGDVLELDCAVGCSLEEVLKALGLTSEGLPSVMRPESSEAVCLAGEGQDDPAEGGSEEPGECSQGSDGAKAPFPLRLFPTPVRDYVEALASSRSVDPAIPATLALAAVGSAIGLSRELYDEFADWREIPVIWAGIVGKSGTRKSILQRDLFFVHEARQLELMRTYRLELSRYKEEHGARRQQEREPIDGAPAAPVLEHVLTSDVTPEALVALLQNSPRGVLVSFDELSGFFGGLGRYSGKTAVDRALYLSLFAGTSIKQDRKTRDVVFLELAAACIVGGIQPGVLADAFDEAALQSGLASRFLLARGQSRVKQYLKGPSREAKSKYEVLLRGLFSLEMQESEGSGGDARYHAQRVLLAEDAREVLRAFVPDWSADGMLHGDDVEAAMSKLEAYSLRFALVLRLCREVLGNAGPCDEVSADDMQAGIELARWYRDEAASIYRDLRVGSVMTRTSILNARCSVLRDRFDGRATPREWRKFNTRRSTQEAKAELDELVSSGRAQWSTRKAGPKGGRPTEECVLQEEA